MLIRLESFWSKCLERRCNLQGALRFRLSVGNNEKDRLNLGDSLGNKYPLFLLLMIFLSRVLKTRDEKARDRHGFDRLVWKEVQALQRDYVICIYGNESAWWNGDITLEFLRYHLRNRQLSIMLILDDISGHWSPEVKLHARQLNIVHAMLGCRQILPMYPLARNVHRKGEGDSVLAAAESRSTEWQHLCRLSYASLRRRTIAGQDHHHDARRASCAS